MEREQPQQPIVVAVDANDPSGGGGLAAASETVASLGGHCTPITASLTACDTREIKDYQAVETGLFIEQLRAILEDVDPALLVCGELGSLANAEALHSILSDYPGLPVIAHFKQDSLEQLPPAALCSLLIPFCDLCMINEECARELSPGADSIDACAQGLLETGCDNLLITGCGAKLAAPGNRLYSAHRGLTNQYPWQALPQQYSGAGDTLCYAIATYLAHGFNLSEAVLQGHSFTHQALIRAKRIGMGKLVPDRFHWSHSD